MCFENIKLDNGRVGDTCLLKEDTEKLFKMESQSNFELFLKKKYTWRYTYDLMSQKVFFLICFLYDSKGSGVIIKPDLTIVKFLTFYFLNKQYWDERLRNIIPYIINNNNNLKNLINIELEDLIRCNKIIYSSIATVLFLVLLGLRMKSAQPTSINNWFLKMIDFLSAEINTIEKNIFWVGAAAVSAILLLGNKHGVGYLTKKYSVLNLILNYNEKEKD
jgi:hypothetical protein